MSHVARIIPILLFPWMLLSSVYAQQDAPKKNVVLFDHIQPITNEEAGGLHNSCWGYTAPNGREYAFFGTQIGTSIVDITEKPIREVAFIRGPKSTWRNIKVYKHYAYISTEDKNVEAGAGLQIVDLSLLPDTATLVRTDTNTFISAHTLWIADHYLYAMGTKAEVEVNGGAVILDLEPDPTNPKRVGGVDHFYYHDAFVRNDTLIGAGVNGDGCDIYDVSDKATPVPIATITYPFSGTHNAEMTQDGKYVVTSDEVGFTKKTMKVWDIHDPDDIVMVAEYSPNLVETIHNVRINGRYAFVAWYTAGMRIIDLIDPQHPREVGFYDTYQGSDGGFNGAWEVYPHFPSGKIAISDRNSGLYIVEFNQASAGSLSGRILDRETNEPIPNASIQVVEEDRIIESDGAGRYYIGGTNGDNRNLQISQFGYHNTTLEITLSGDQTQDILLDPIPFKPLNLRAVEKETGRPITGFSYTFGPHTESILAEGESTSITLPIGERVVITVGKWGYGLAPTSVTATEAMSEIVVELSPRYQDDATLDLGWSYESPEDNATTGRWNRIYPYLGFPRSDWVHPPTEPAGSKGRIFFTGQPPKFAPPERDDINNGRTTLTSPLMNLSKYIDPLIVFDLWSIHFEREEIVDTLVVELSNNNGNSWVSAYREIKGTSGWKRHVIFVRDHLFLSDQMRIRFRASDSLGNILVVAGMDNFDVMDRLFTSAPEEHRQTSSAISIAPNPTNGSTTITLASSGEHISLEIISILGKTIATPYQDYLPLGKHSIPINLNVPPGSYLLKVTGEGWEDAIQILRQ